MIDYSDFGKLNEYDEIILNWKNDERAPKMKYLIIEDIESKCWIVYDSSTGLYKEVPFGEYAEFAINEFLSYDKSSVHHQSFMEFCQDNDFEIDEEKNSILFDTCKIAVTDLVRILGDLPKYRALSKKGNLIGNNGARISQGELDIIMLDIWKEYRYLCFPQAWASYAEHEFATIKQAKDFLDRHSFIKSTPDKTLKEWKEHAREHGENLHKIITESFVCYHDYVTFVDKDEKQRVGRAFVTSSEIYMYCWDLFHILVSKIAEEPHICPRCNQLFFSNNNKAKYCADCRKAGNILRNESRKKSVRYIHKKIYDKINNSKHRDKRELEMFLAESNYYWDIVKGKDVNQIPIFKEKIETEEDYRKWLEKKLNSL